MGAILALLARPLIEAAVSVFGQIILDFWKTWKAAQDARALGRAEAALKSLEEENARVEKANAARRAAAATGMRDDDPYLRDD